MTKSTSSNARAVIALAAALGCGIAVYLCLYQWRVVSHVWDPLFDGGSERILNSSVSRLLPVPDACLGAIAYALETVVACIGLTRRWRNSALIAIASGCVGWLLGAVGVVLVVMQAFVFHAWCLLCLCSAGLSLLVACMGTPQAIAAFRNRRRYATSALT